MCVHYQGKYISTSGMTCDIYDPMQSSVKDH